MKYLNQTHSYFLSCLTVTTKLISTISCKARIHSQARQRNQNPSSSQRRRSTLLKSSLRSNSFSKEAVLLFQQMQRNHTSSIDSFSLLLVLKACTHTSSPIEGKQIHAHIISLGFGSLIFLQTTLVNMYSSVGYLHDAHQMFSEMSQRNVVSWTTLISAYVNSGNPNKALSLFRQMQMEKVEPDRVTVTIALSACADLGALETGEWIHTHIRRNQLLKPDLSLNNALLNMYAKCGDIKSACQLFDELPQRDVTTWTSIIVGHAIHGQAEQALRLFSEMSKSDDLWPNEITFIGVLMACSHGGLVEEAHLHLESMSKVYGLKPRVCHYGCMVDLLGRAGLLKQAYDFIENMPIKPNSVIWRTLLGACTIHGEVELGARVRQRLLELEPWYVGDDIAMANLYAGSDMWGEKEMARKRVKGRKVPGCSLIEVESRVHEFAAADRRGDTL